MKTLLLLVFFSVSIRAEDVYFSVADGTKGNQLLYEALNIKEKQEGSNQKLFSKSGDNFKCEKQVIKANSIFKVYGCKFKVDSVGFKKGFISKGTENKHHIGFGGKVAKELFQKTNKKNLKTSKYTNINYNKKIFDLFELMETEYTDGEIPTDYTFSVKLGVKK